jgi:prepilin-type N-terminal cleavage/methylation domain-containing protein
MRAVKDHSGFTIVELLIVIVVIGILAALVLNTFSSAQARARDADRINDVNTIKKALETYYTLNSSYPNSNQVRNATFRRDELKLAEDAVRSPSGSSIGYCWSTSPNQYCYVAYRWPGGPAGDCTGGGTDSVETCRGYTISYRLEKDSTTRIDVRGLSN